METLTYIESVIKDSFEGVWINVNEISSFHGDGGSTSILMKNGTKHTVKESFESFCEKMRKAFR